MSFQKGPLLFSLEDKPHARHQRSPPTRRKIATLALELVRVTEAAALAASRWMGRGNKIEADGAATEAMRRAFDTVAIDGTVVIGEGEMDEAPMLFIGEKVGAGGPKMDIAVDPLEGTTLTAKGGPNALTVVALAESGNFLHAPDCYMDKIAVGGGLPDDVVSLDASVHENLRNLARAKKRDVSDLVLCTLDRDRHAEIIAKSRELGCRIMLIPDGDVAGVIAAALPDSDIDIFWGIGGAPEGVIAAAAPAVFRRPDAGPADVRGRGAGSAVPHDGHHRSEADLPYRGDGEGGRDVRRHGCDVGCDAARRAAARQCGGDAFDRDAQQERHDAVYRGAP